MVILVIRRSSQWKHRSSQRCNACLSPLASEWLLPPHRPGRLRSRAEAAGTGPAAGQRGRSCSVWHVGRILESGPVGAPSTRPRRDPSRLSRRPLGRLLSAGAPVCGASRASFTTLGSAFRRSRLVREKRAFLFWAQGRLAGQPSLLG